MAYVFQADRAFLRFFRFFPVGPLTIPTLAPKSSMTIYYDYGTVPRERPEPRCSRD